MAEPVPFQALETVEQLFDAAARQGLVLTPESGALDTMGLDFLVVHARDADGVRWVVRSPRRAEVAVAAEHEARVLALLGPALPVAVPDWRVVASDVIAYPRLGGVPAVTMDAGAPTWNIIDPAAPLPVFLDSVAAALFAMQAVSVEDARAAGVRTSTVPEARALVREGIAVAMDVVPIAPSVVARWLRWLDDDTMWPSHTALGHNDLHPGHLLLAPDGRLTGILDWTEAQVTDPAVDFAMMHMCFGRDVLDQLLARFERLGGTTWSRMTEHAIERSYVFPALGAAWAVRAENAAILDYCRGQLLALEG